MIDQTEELKENSEEYPLSPAIPEEMPRPAFWTFLMAFGTLFLFWGMATSLIISFVGLVTMGISLAGWIGELSDE